MEPLDFLSRTPPFDHLDAAQMESVRRALEVVYFAAGTAILRRDGEPAGYLYVVRKGSVRIERGGRVMDLLEEGELFGYPSLLAGRVSFDSIAAEDVLAYRLPGALFERLLQEAPGFAAFFLRGIGERLRRMPGAATDGAALLGGGGGSAAGPGSAASDLALPVRQLVEREPLWIAPGETVAEAARRMRDHHTSSLLVEPGSPQEPAGILTDRDLRSRVLAADRGPATRVGEVATRPLRTLPAEASLLEALLYLLEHGVHHLPLTGADGSILGVVTDTTLLRHYARSPLGVLHRLERTSDLSSLDGFADRVHGIVEGLLRTHVAPLEVARVVSALNDRLARSLLRLGERELGAPPCEYAWIVFGSQGRMEQALLTDQDNGLAWEADTEAQGAAAAAYFPQLARFVVDALLRAGFAPCPGGYMATRWCFPLAEWRRLFRSWIDSPTPQEVLDASNVFDLRSVHGLLSLAPLEAARREAAHAPPFLAAMVHAALAFRPPLGLFRTIREEDGGVDIKRGALVPIAGMARVLAIVAGSDFRSTVDRLRAAATEPARELSSEDVEGLTEAYDFVYGLRLRTQLEAILAGREPDNRIALERLTARERRRLKDVFVLVRELQAVATQRFPAEGLGWETS